MKRLRENEHITGYVFSAPFVLGFLIFTLYPILSSLYYSFTNYNLMEAPRWLGLGNYERLFLEDDKIGKSFQVTFTYVFASVPLRLIFALFVAMILNTATKAVGLYRSAFYLPSLIGGSVAVAIMWQQIFGDKGLVNSALSLFGIHSTTSWIGNPSTALWTLIALSIWQFGSSMIIFLAGLKNIPKDYYEAASVDGANAVHRFFKITLPMLSPIILFNLTLQTISAFLTFTPPILFPAAKAARWIKRCSIHSIYTARRSRILKWVTRRLLPGSCSLSSVS